MDSKPKEMEDRIMKFWEAKRIYEKTKKNRRKVEKWYFLDGPPYATGSIHVGTAMNKVIKDFWLRYYRMLGYNVWAQPGYDTHGVPIENKVEKMLGFEAKGDIEDFGVDKFVQKCKEFATKFIGVMGDQFANLGVWMDWDKPYMTLTNDYIEGAWFTFKKAFEQGLLYRGTYSVHVCPRCETAVAYNEIEYKEVDDNSIYVKFKVRNKKDEYLVVWTTTPWTIPSNTGVMANPDADYVRVRVGEDVLILGKDLLENLMGKFKVENYKVLETFKGSELEGLKYEHPLVGMFEFLHGLVDAHRVVLSDRFVSLEEGTGLVHTAPGHGQEDYMVGKEEGLPVVNPLKMDGTFGSGSGKYEGVFAKDADKMILDELKRRGTILAEETIRHDYPMCWRCNSPLLMMAVPQWFFRVTKIRDQLLAENEKINWVPKWAGQRFKNWLESLGDWPISRQRYWGIPLPIWVCEKCEEIIVVGSREELPTVPEDFHKPHIDDITMKCKCGSVMRRVPDVLDVWFDSGVAGWASLGYPKDKKLFKKLWPVDFVLEGPDQIRGWWNSCMITSMMTFGRKAFDNVLFHGFVLDAHGNKMSKSKGNIVTTEEAIDKYGRDVLRFYYLSRPVWDDMYFNVEDLNELAKAFIVVRNIFNFVKTYVQHVPKAKPKKMKKEDRWLLSRLNNVVLSSTKHFNNFVSNRAAKEILDFILNDFSRWYIKIVRDRVWPEYDGKDKDAALYTLLTAADTIAKLLAPFCPFLAEHVYQDVIRPLKTGKKTKASIHMEDWPNTDKKEIDERLEKDMEVVKQIVEASYAARHDAGLKLRWPVASVAVVSEKEEVSTAVKNLEEVLNDMCNAKKVAISTEAPVEKIVKDQFAKVESDVGTVLVDIKMSPKLLKEALFRELVRKIQNMRKKAGLHVSDRIILTLQTDEKTGKSLKKVSKELMKEVGADKVDIGKLVGNNKGRLKFKSIEIGIAFSKK